MELGDFGRVKRVEGSDGGGGEEGLEPLLLEEVIEQLRRRWKPLELRPLPSFSTHAQQLGESYGFP